MGAVLDFLNILWVALVFVTMISILVAAHELGHYLFARMFNMGVEEFAIGFGKNPLVTWKRKFYTVPLGPGQNPGIEVKEGNSHDGLSRLEGRAQADRIEIVGEGDGAYLRERTDFTIRPWPLGGFVRIKGMMPEDDGSETRVAGGFYSKPPWQRLLVLFAGPLFSVIAGIAILVPLFMFHGAKRPVNEPIIASLRQDGPAGKAKIEPGDRVISIDNRPVEKFYDLVLAVRGSGGKELSLVIERKGRRFDTKLMPVLSAEEMAILGPDLKLTKEKKRQYVMKAGFDESMVRLGFGEAVSEAVRFPIEATTGLIGVFTRPSTFKENVGGPGTMFKATQQAVQLGVPSVLLLSALLSISVGIFNLLPAPPLDGGQMAIALAEMFRGGRRLSMKVQMTLGTMGMAFVFLLVLSALTVDVMRAFEKKEPAPELVKPSK